MSEATGLEAKTIHRLLEYTVSDGQPVFSRHFSNPLDGDVFIIDELSMVDIHLMRALLFAVPDGARLIIVGDADQLPSIGPGCVLRDIISSECVPVITLSEIFRQKIDSVIVLNAHRINKGQMPLTDNSYNDFKLVVRESKPSIVETVIKLCSEYIPERFGFSPDDIQVLSPNRKQEDGVINLNRLLQAKINPPLKAKKEINLGHQILRVSDKVMQIRNDYQLEWKKFFDNGLYDEGMGVFNGDMGKVDDIDGEGTVTVLFDDGKKAQYDAANLEDIITAYAISIHKSQGCEFPCVVIPISMGSPYLYNRNLLYTAVTRARELVVLVGSGEAIQAMVSNVSMLRRYSSLTKKLRAEFAKD